MIKQKRIIQTLIDLVKIDSPSGEEKLISQEVAKRLKKLGGKVKFDSYSNIICKFPGNGDPILLNCHLDTVEPGRNILPQIKGDRIVFDGDAEVHNIFVSSPGYRRMDFTVTGRSAHAGVEPEKGISAIEIATKIISSLKLGRIDEETT